MAIVQYTAIVQQLRGKLNGSVFNRSRTAYTLGGKQNPPKGMTIAQGNHRVRFGEIQRLWRTLTPIFKQSWEQTAATYPVRDRFGQLVHISGYNWFIRANILRSTVNLPAVQVSLLTFTSEYVFTVPEITRLIVGTNDGRTSINFLASFNVLTSSPRNVSYVVSFSPPVSNGVTKYYGNYYVLTDKFIPSNVPVGSNQTIEINLRAREGFPAYSPGDLVYVRILFFTPENGITYQEFVLSHVAT